MNIIDSLAKEIKYKLPKLTDYFGKSICSIRNISIIDNEVYIETTDKHNLFNNQKIFIKNVSIPCKITSINGKIITINNYHHLISNLTNSVSILNEKNPKYNGDNIPLELDIDGKTLKLNIDGVDDYIDNEPQGYLILNHDQIVNGFREIEVINDTKIKLKDYKLKDYIDVKAYIKNANITIGQRVFGCLDLDDAINEYSLNFLNENNKITNKEREDLTCYICLEPKIVSEHADGYSGGLMNYNLLLYVFIPIFNKNKYKVREIIEYITFGIFNRILGNKYFKITNYLSNDLFTNNFVFENCYTPINRNNELMIHCLNYSFNIQTKDNDFEIPSDYWRLNNLHLDTIDNKVFNINY